MAFIYIGFVRILNRVCFAFIILALAVSAAAQGTQGESVPFQAGTTRVTGVPVAAEDGGPRTWCDV